MDNNQNQNIHIWVDADSCPSLVRDYILRYSQKLSLKVTFVANKQISTKETIPFEMIICSAEKDAADNFIFDHTTQNDIVITRDIVFAQRLVEKQITTINDRGTVFSKENIGPMITERNYNLQLAEMGLVKHYNEGYDKKKFSAFANCFDKTIHQKLATLPRQGKQSE